VPLTLGRIFIIWPRDKVLIFKAKRIFANHPAVKIAVAGSYGKTTVKELLLTVLSEAKKTAATPANKNVASSHAKFARRLIGDEEILIIEYGEGKPGDIKRYTGISSPDIGFITGVAPAHLDGYGTVENAAKDIFYLAEYLDKKPVYVNTDSEACKPHLSDNSVSYNSKGTENWKTKDLKIGIDGMSFTVAGANEEIKLKTPLVGEHLIGVLVAIVDLAKRLGVENDVIARGIAKTKPFTHRMEIKHFHGAYLIDDTYNGNIEGMKAGLNLLVGLPGSRKIYVTPGLVEQGDQKEKVHLELGKAINKANPDIVVLMKNSATPFIQKGMEGYKGKCQVIDEPLEFYNSLDLYVAKGDVVLMQNDWTDNYA